MKVLMTGSIEYTADINSSWSNEQQVSKIPHDQYDHNKVNI